METIFITGANRGLGKGFVEYSLKKGYKVFAGVRKPENFPKELKENKNLKVVEIDVSNDESIRKAAQTVSEQTEHLDFLVNNAGVNKDSATNNHKEEVCNLKSLDRQSLQKMFDVNSISPLLITKYFLKLLNSNPGFIINISSCRASSHDEIPNSSANYGYRASKAALNMMVLSSILDLPKNVKTFTVHPGSVKTDMNPEGTDKPQDQAKAILKITENWNDDFNGKFLRYSGELYPL